MVAVIGPILNFLVDDTRCCCSCRPRLHGFRGSRLPSVHHLHKLHMQMTCSWLGCICFFVPWTMPYRWDVSAWGPSWRRVCQLLWRCAFCLSSWVGNAPRSNPDWRPSSRPVHLLWRSWGRGRLLQQRHLCGLWKLGSARCRSFVARATRPSHDEDRRVYILVVSPKLRGLTLSWSAKNLISFHVRH